MENVKRILTIDGGGILGVVPASILATLEEQLGQHPADYFDLIAGTSTGGIIALGLGLRVPAKEILEFYETYGPSIFPHIPWWNLPRRVVRGLKMVCYAKYDKTPLHNALTEVFGSRLLGESQSRLIIPSMDLTTGDVRLWKTAHLADCRIERDPKVPVVDVALSTSAAPTYFPPHLTPSGAATLDGGIWANNPVNVAVIEAVGNLGWDRNSLQILSLGCTRKPPEYRGVRKGGLFGWGKGLRVIDVFMEGQAKGALGLAQTLAGEGGKERGSIVLRVEQTVHASLAEMDDATKIRELCGLGEHLAKHNLPSIRRRFIAPGLAEPFIPYPVPGFDDALTPA